MGTLIGLLFVAILGLAYLMVSFEIHHKIASLAKASFKKVAPNSFAMERLTVRVENVALRLRKINDRRESTIFALYPMETIPQYYYMSRKDRDRVELENEEQNKRRYALNQTAHLLESTVQHLENGVGTPEHRNRLIAIVQDTENLLDLSPAVGVKTCKSYGGSTWVEVQWDDDVEFSEDVLEMFLKRLGEVHESAEALDNELDGLEQERRDAQGTDTLSKLSKMELSSTGNQNRGLPKISVETIPETQRSTFEKAMAKANSLPLIESERVKRILADSAEAQALAAEAEENGEISFDGRTPDEMVANILEDNAQRLNRTMEQVIAGGGAVERLRALEMFTEERSRA